MKKWKHFCGCAMRCLIKSINKKRLLLLVFVMISQVLLTLALPWPVKSIIDNLNELVPTGQKKGHLSEIAYCLECVKHALDDLFHTSDLRFLWIMLLVLLGLYLLHSIFQYVQNIQMSKLGQEIVLEVRRTFLSHIISLPHSFFVESRSGELTSRVSNDTADIQAIMESFLITAIRSVPSIIGILIISYMLDFIYFLTFLIVVPFLLIMQIFFTIRIRKSMKKQKKAEGALASDVQEALYNHAAVMTLSLENKVLDEVMSEGKRSADMTNQASREQGRMTAFLEMMTGLTTGVVLFIGALRVYTGCQTIGQLLIFLSYLKSMFKPIQYISKFTTRLAKSMSAIERLDEILLLNPSELGATESKHAVKAPPFKGNVAFKDVSFNYRDKVELFNNFSLQIGAGERVAIVGDSGSGKSTLVHMLLRLYDPETGTILIDGNPINRFTFSSLRNQMAVVLQDSFIFNTSITANIAVSKPGATEEEIRYAAQEAEADEFIDELPQGMDTVLGEGGGGLSGGQKRRLAIARAFLRDAPIVVLDEPTAGLDAFSEKKVTEAIERLTRNKTALLVTHQLSTVEEMDRIILLQSGRIVESGTFDELMEKQGEFHRMYISQLSPSSRN